LTSPKEQQNDLHQRVPFVLEVMHRIVVRRIGEQVEPSRLVREERNDWDERKGRVESFAIERHP